jgi:hypothetical protein
MTATVNILVVLYRNRTQSLTDKEISTPENRVDGDAAFADYLINMGLAWRISKKTRAVFNSLLFLNKPKSPDKGVLVFSKTHEKNILLWDSRFRAF